MRPSRVTPLFGLVAALAFALPGVDDAASARAARAAAPAPATQAVLHPQWLTGTVSRFDAHTRTVVLMTGVGHALRVSRIELPPELTVKAAGAASPASALVPGCIVRVECRSTPAGATIASSVELLAAPAAARTP